MNQFGLIIVEPGLLWQVLIHTAAGFWTWLVVSYYGVISYGGYTLDQILGR